MRSRKGGGSEGVSRSRCIPCPKAKHEGREGHEAHEEAASRRPHPDKTPGVVFTNAQQKTTPGVLLRWGLAWRSSFVCSMTFAPFVFAFETGNAA